MKHTHLAGIAASFVTAAFGWADSITFHSSGIPFRDCRIAAIQSGQVQYVDPNNRRQMREIRDINMLSFDGLEELDEAEKLLKGDTPEAAVLQMLRALRAAETDVQRLWIRYRLVQVHDAIGEYVQAVGHAAEFFRMTDSADWILIKPFSDPKPAHYAATREALTNLERAKRDVGNPQLMAAIDELIATIRPIHDEAAQRYDGPAIPIGSTLSGIGITVIETGVNPAPAETTATTSRDDVVRDDNTSADVTQPATVMAKPEEQTPEIRNAAQPVVSSSPTAPNSATSIDTLLRDAAYSDALARCEQIARAPGDREIGRFLVQYGHALAGTGRPRDAAVMFTRCALLYDGTPHSVQALIETARIYRDTFNRQDTCIRLLRRAIDRAELLDLEADAAVARELISTLNDIDL